MTDTDTEAGLTSQLPVERSRLRGHAGATADDARLVEGVRAHRPGALEAIFDRYGPALLSFCRHMLGSREDAEDALQHVMLSAHRAMQGSEREIHLRAWLFAIARNRCRSMLRARRPEVPLEDADRWSGIDGLAAEVERREDLRAMVVDLRRLPEEQRAALLLAELGAHSHDEIATVLGVRPGKVKALVFQAREALAAARTARETPCAEIREQLATLRGSALRRGLLRRHVEGCPGCREFEAEVARQRAAFAVLLPVAPSAALKTSVLGAAATGAGGAAAGGGMLALAQGGAAKLLAAAAVVGAAGGGGYVAVTDHGRSDPPPARAAAGPGSSDGGERRLQTPSPAGFAPAFVFGAPVASVGGPGRASGVAPGQAKRSGAGAPGASGGAPGHTKRSGAGSPGASGGAPGHTKRSGAGTPGASGGAPGHTKRSGAGSPGASGVAPGQTKRSAASSPGASAQAGRSAPAASAVRSGRASRGQDGAGTSRRSQVAPATSGRSAGPASRAEGAAHGRVTGPPTASKRSDPAGAPLADAPADRSGSDGSDLHDRSRAPLGHGKHGRSGRS